MRLLGYLLLATCVLIGLRVAFGVLAVVWLIAILYSAVTKPAETFGMLGLFTFWFLLERYPLAALAFVAVVVAASSPLSATAD